MRRRTYLSLTPMIGSLAVAGCSSSEAVELEYQESTEYTVDLEFTPGTTFDPPIVTAIPGNRLAHFADYLLLETDNEQIEWETVGDGSVDIPLEEQSSNPAHYTLKFMEGGSVSFDTYSGGSLVETIPFSLVSPAE